MAAVRLFLVLGWFRGGVLRAITEGIWVAGQRQWRVPLCWQATVKLSDCQAFGLIDFKESVGLSSKGYVMCRTIWHTYH